MKRVIAVVNNVLIHRGSPLPIPRNHMERLCHPRESGMLYVSNVPTEKRAQCSVGT